MNTLTGRNLLREEVRQVRRALDGIFGDQFVQIGAWGDAGLFRRLARTRRAAVITRATVPGSDAVSAADAMAIASDSIDAVLLPHTLELADDPHAVLREVDRILRPDGNLVVLGFNPWGWWGLRHTLSRQGVSARRPEDDLRRTAVRLAALARVQGASLGLLLFRARPCCAAQLPRHRPMTPRRRRLLHAPRHQPSLRGRPGIRPTRAGLGVVPARAGVRRVLHTRGAQADLRRDADTSRVATAHGAGRRPRQSHDAERGVTAVEIHTDGACRGNPGPGGWGAVLRAAGTEKEIWGGELATTNNRMELTAAIMALESLQQTLPRAGLHRLRVPARGHQEWLSRLEAAWMEDGQPQAGEERGSLAAARRAWPRSTRCSGIGSRVMPGTADNERADELANRGLDEVLEFAIEDADA